MTNAELHEKAVKALSDIEVSKMEHCIGWDKRKVYHRNGMAYFKPYRNYYDAGGTDIAIWERLTERGFAYKAREKKDGGCYYWLNKTGLNILSAYEEVYIYSDNANGNEIDASEDVLEVLLDDAVYCGYGCWLPSGAKSIATRARLPLKLTMDTLRYLRDKCGYVRHDYEGECDDEGFPHCTHGWSLTKKWIDENRKQYREAEIAEFARVDAMIRGEEYGVESW